jgi:hypothetical protein
MVLQHIVRGFIEQLRRKKRCVGPPETISRWVLDMFTIVLGRVMLWQKTRGTLPKEW